jgi:hypothetical protein
VWMHATCKNIFDSAARTCVDAPYLQKHFESATRTGVDVRYLQKL